MVTNLKRSDGLVRSQQGHGGAAHLIEGRMQSLFARRCRVDHGPDSIKVAAGDVLPGSAEPRIVPTYSHARP